jgi:uncharacterized protein
MVRISYDPAKRALTLVARQLDFEDAPKLFEGDTLTIIDDRFDYGETRFITYGWLETVAVAVVWTERDLTRRIISMRRMHEEEIVHVGLDRP